MKLIAFIVISTFIALALILFLSYPLAVHTRVGLFAVAVTPETAIRDMLNNRGVIHNFKTSDEALVSDGIKIGFTYTVVPKNGLSRLEKGTAVVTLRRGGWSVRSANLQSQ